MTWASCAMTMKKAMILKRAKSMKNATLMESAVLSPVPGQCEGHEF